ncbi:tyrosine-type recombinase/integrase [Blastococcus sp. SYSU DS1021]
MKGSTFRRCGCRDNAGKLLTSCPRLGRERGHGSWYYRADVGRDASGRRREQRKGGFPTKAEADAALAAVLHAANTGDHRHDGRQTVGAYLAAWLANREADGLRASTAVMYRRYVERDIVPALGHVRLGDLRPGHVEKLMRDLRVAGRGATTMRRIHATLRSALSSARRARLVPYNAATDVSLPSVRPAKVEPWSGTELATFLDHSAGHRLGALFEVMAFTGLRRGEAVALRWADVDLEHGVITVRSQLVEVGGKAVEGKPKTRSGEDRRVDIGQRTIGALLAHRLVQDAERDTWAEGYTDNGRVFAREDGTDLAPSQVTKVFTRLTTAAGLRAVRLHDLRHGAASLMLAAGADIAVVSKRMGHSSIRVTVDTYSHLLPGVGRSAAEAAESLVRPRATA